MVVELSLPSKNCCVQPKVVAVKLLRAYSEPDNSTEHPKKKDPIEKQIHKKMPKVLLFKHKFEPN